MSTISNSEKQSRFRKKETLKHKADDVFREWQIRSWNNITRTPEEVRAFLDNVSNLPSGWTNEDYQRAEKNLGQFYLELYDNPHQLENDVYCGMNFIEEFKTTPDPTKLMNDEKKAVEKAHLLAAHLVSALKLSGCTNSEQSAAIMEVVRFIGRSLNTELEIPKSNATSICLASIGPQYERPEWFTEKLTETLAWNIGKDISIKVGDSLKNFKY